MESECLMVNCRNLAPDDQALCAKHRDTRERKLEKIPHAELLVMLAVANEVIAEQLEVRKRLEEDLAGSAARHREAAIKQRDAEIVAWLRQKAQIHHRIAAELKHGEDLRIHHLSLSRAYSETADAIERGEVGE